jgi:hypothetical protein
MNGKAGSSFENVLIGIRIRIEHFAFDATKATIVIGSSLIKIKIDMIFICCSTSDYTGVRISIAPFHQMIGAKAVLPLCT